MPGIILFLLFIHSFIVISSYPLEVSKDNSKLNNNKLLGEFSWTSNLFKVSFFQILRKYRSKYANRL